MKVCSSKILHESFASLHVLWAKAFILDCLFKDIRRTVGFTLSIPVREKNYLLLEQRLGWIITRIKYNGFLNLWFLPVT